MIVPTPVLHMFQRSPTCSHMQSRASTIFTSERGLAVAPVNTPDQHVHERVFARDI